MSSLAEVAQRAGVSKATASRALSGSGYVSDTARTKVAAAAAALGYVVSSNAASLVTGRSRNVGVVIPFISRWFFAEVLEGIEETLIDAGYDLTLYRLSEDPVRRQRVFDYFLVRKRVDAVIPVGIALTAGEVAQLHALGKPIVGIGGPIPDITTMSIDDVGIVRTTTEHVLSLGHRQVLHLGGDIEEQMDFHVHARRLQGFREATTAAGIPGGGDFVSTTFDIQGGYRAALDLLAHPTTRPTAIVAGCDEIAIGTITAARQLGIAVPSQLSVVGVDDHPLADMFGLTTVRQDPRGQGARSVELVMDEMRTGAVRSEPSLLVAPTTLKVRSSTTAPPAG